MQGVDKGLVDYQGRPLIEHALEKISPQLDDIILSAHRNAQRYSAYATRVVPDENSGYSGPLSSMASYLPFCRHALALVVACDMPPLPRDLVDFLYQAMAPHQLAIITCDQKPQLAMLVSTPLLTSLNDALQCSEYKLIDWVRAQDHISCEHPQPGAFINLNSPHDLKA